jgi:hypothetical protein
MTFSLSMIGFCFESIRLKSFLRYRVLGENICILAKFRRPHESNESQCREKGGHFTAKTKWLVHVWISKDNPAGVSTPDNPDLR